MAFCSAMSRTLQVLSEDDVGLESRSRQLVATIEQRARDLLRVALVHLAAVGFDEKFRHSRGPTIHKCARLAISGTPQSLGRNSERSGKENACGASSFGDLSERRLRVG